MPPLPLVLPLLLFVEEDSEDDEFEVVESSSLDSDSFLTLTALLSSALTSSSALRSTMPPLFAGETPLAFDVVVGVGAAASEAAVASVSRGSGSLK